MSTVTEAALLAAYRTIIESKRARIAERDAKNAADRIVIAAMEEELAAHLGESGTNTHVAAATIAEASPLTGDSHASNGTGHQQTMTMVEHVSAVLREAGHQLKVEEIVGRLEEKGVHKPGAAKGLRGAVDAALSRRKDLFQSVGVATYVIRDEAGAKSAKSGRKTTPYGSNKARVFAAIIDRWATIGQIAEATGMSKAQVRNIVSGTWCKESVERRIENGDMLYKVRAATKAQMETQTASE